MNALIAIEVQAEGRVISSNLDEFRAQVRAALATIQRNPTTDEEFAQAELDVKTLKTAKQQITEAKAKALASAEQLHRLFAAFDEAGEEIDADRLALEKQIAKRKEEVKAGLVDEALDMLGIDEARARRHYAAKLADAMKGKRTLDTMRKALTIYATTQAAVIRRSRELIEQFIASHGRELVPDALDLELKSPELVEGDLRRRLEIRKLEAQRRELEAEAAKQAAERAAATPPTAAAPAATAVRPVAAPMAPPPVAAMPGLSADDELAAFKRAVVAAFQPLRAAKASLRHDAVREAADRFSAAVNAAFLAMQLPAREEVA